MVIRQFEEEVVIMIDGHKSEQVPLCERMNTIYGENCYERDKY